MKRWSKKSIVFAPIGAALVIALIYQWWTGSPPTAPVTQIAAVGGTYGELTDPQRRLVDDWIARYTKATGTQTSPQAIYDGLALSTRTTFNAVTHALSHTQLTTSDGKSMNLSALDLVEKIDAVAGSIPGAGGDRQFRMYVTVRPETPQTLEAAREFARQIDNTVYHKGYPTCFRGVSGTPSIQISLARDGRRADIDVDYRSSSFPIMLINGHLTATNSDVRAGNNDERHNGRWTGLPNWWRSVMGLATGDLPSATPAGTVEVASAPRRGKGTKPEDAIFDFLQAWIVEQKPGVAVGYMASRSFSCLEAERGVAVDRGVARFQMAHAMSAVSDRIGRQNRVADAIHAVSLTGERGRPMPQPYGDVFQMYDVREDLAESFDCDNRLHPEQADPKKGRSTKFGTYVGAVFRVQTAAVRGESIATIWAQDGGAWTLVSYDVEPEATLSALPSDAPVSADTPQSAITGDNAMTTAATNFFDAWLVKRDYAAAFRLLSPSAYACYNVYRPDAEPEADSPARAGQLIESRLKNLSEWAGTGTRLEDLLVAVEPNHPDVKLIMHEHAAAFSIIQIPDGLAAAIDCGHRARGEMPRFDRNAARTYGRFYATSTRLTEAGTDAAVLWLVWARDGQAWKIVSYLVVTP